MAANLFFLWYEMRWWSGWDTRDSIHFFLLLSEEKTWDGKFPLRKCSELEACEHMHDLKMDFPLYSIELLAVLCYTV